MDNTDPIPVPIDTDSIKLGQFLKLANVVETGAHAKEVLAEGIVTVNGEVDTRRGRQLRNGDEVVVDVYCFEVVADTADHGEIDMSLLDRLVASEDNELGT